MDSTNTSIRKLNEKYFRLMEYIKFEDIGPLVEELYAAEREDRI